MLRVVARGKDGQQIVVLGLSFANLDRLRAGPDGKTFIKVVGQDIGVPVDILIFCGETEAHMAEMMQDMIGPNTRVTIDPKLKS